MESFYSPISWSCLLAKYSSGSAGGTVTEPAGVNTGGAPPAEVPGREMPVNPPVPAEPVEVSQPAKLEPKPTLDYYQQKEDEMMDRLDKHMKMLAEKFEHELLEKKRAAEHDLDVEIGIKRQKRLQELDDEVRDEKCMKEAHLASLDAQLAEKMQLVADEQTALDELKEKSKRLQRDLEAAADPPGLHGLSTPCSKQLGTSSSDRDAMKAKLKEKLNETVNKNKSSPAPSSLPSPPSSAERDAGVVAVVPEGKGGEVALLPVTTMRFTSSTHPEAWHFLYRLNKKVDSADQLPDWQKEVYEQWHAGH